MLYGLAFGINNLQLTRLAKSRFQRTYVNRLLAALGCPCRRYFDLSSIITVAVNWIVVEVVTSSWGLLRIVVAAGAGIAWKIHKHFEVHELGKIAEGFSHVHAAFHHHLSGERVNHKAYYGRVH